MHGESARRYMIRVVKGTFRPAGNCVTSRDPFCHFGSRFHLEMGGEEGGGGSRKAGTAIKCPTQGIVPVRVNCRYSAFRSISW
jgi:hypothetical protein